MAGMPGFLEPIWEAVFKIATWSALIFGALSIGSAFISAWVGWEITDATQKDADKKIKASDERIAEFNAREKEAELKLEQLRKEVAPRSLGPEFLAALKDQPGANVQILYVRDAPDTYWFAMQIFITLQNLPGWTVSFPETIREEMRKGPLKSFDLPAAIWVRGQPSGISIVSSSSFKTPAVHVNEGKSAVDALMQAFLASLQAVSWASDPELPEGTLRIVVAPKR